MGRVDAVCQICSDPMRIDSGQPRICKKCLSGWEKKQKAVALILGVRVSEPVTEEKKGE